MAYWKGMLNSPILKDEKTEAYIKQLNSLSKFSNSKQWDRDTNLDFLVLKIGLFPTRYGEIN